MAIKKFVLGAFEENTYLITKGNKAVVVDPSLDTLSILDELKDYEIEAVLITHSHIDHIDGVGYFNAPIYVHELDYLGFSDLSYSLYKMCGLKPSFNLKDLNIIKVKDGDKITLPDFEFLVMHTPGHTAGSVCYKYYNNLFSGDTLFRGSCGRTDFPGGDRLAIIRSLKTLIEALDDSVVVYPGHDLKTTIKEERLSNPYILKK